MSGELCVYTVEHRATHPGLSATVQYGVIAQEFQQVYSDFVTTNSEGWLTMNVSPLTFVNTAAIQDLKEESDAKIEELQKQLDSLMQRMNALEAK